MELVFWGPKYVILAHFALRFQWKTLVHFCANNGLLARLVLWSIFCVFQYNNWGLGMMRYLHILLLKKSEKCARFPSQSANLPVFHWQYSAKRPKSAIFVEKKRSVQLRERQFSKAYLFHAPTCITKKKNKSYYSPVCADTVQKLRILAKNVIADKGQPPVDNSQITHLICVCLLVKYVLSMLGGLN